MPSHTYHGWEVPIKGPGAGQVVAAVDGEADRLSAGALSTVALWVYATLIYRPKMSASGEPNIRPNVGNHVMVRVGVRQVALYAYLRQSSLDVAVDDEVDTGTTLAKLGNSGNTTAPHVHIHVLDQMERLLTAELVPFVFACYERWDGSRWLTETNTLPATGQVLRGVPASPP